MIDEGEASERSAARECEKGVGLILAEFEIFETIKTDFLDTCFDKYVGVWYYKTVKSETE